MPYRRLLGPSTILGVALLALHTMRGRAQQSNAPLDADSLAALRHAHGAQRDFERTRRITLPTTFDDHGRCDEHIGRYCYWYDPSDPPPEPAGVARARERLLHELTAAVSRAPGDGWIVGQLVRYLAEHGLADSAVAAARRCGSVRWWCDALEGFADHLAHDYGAAEGAFGRALRNMPSAQRCAWTDLAPLLDDAERYRAVPCAGRDSLDERIWWLARPLYTRRGNDLETEHYARLTMAVLQEDAEPSDGMRWGDDSREIMIRFGWPTRWARAPDRPTSIGPPVVIGDEPSPSFWLFPMPAVTAPWADVTALRWHPTLDRPPARYAPAYARGFAPIDRVQFARFRRGDSTIAVAAFDLTPDSVFATRGADVRLAASRDPITPFAVGAASTTAPRGLVTTTSPWRPAVLSLEAVGADTPWVARARAMTPPDPGPRPAISDILLFAPNEALPESLAAALPLALPTAVLPRDRRVGLYWEMYVEADSTTPTDISISVVRIRAGSELPYPIGRPSCPLGDGAIELRWREDPGRPATLARAVVLDLRTLSRGRYAVAIQISVAEQPRGCSSREIQVVTR